MDDNVKLKDGIDQSSPDQAGMPGDVPELTEKMKKFRRLGGADESSSAGFDVTVETEEAIRGDDALRRYYGYEKVRRRSPRRRRFTRFAIVFTLVSLLVIAIGSVVGWAAAGIWASSSADAFMDDLTENTDNDGWRRLLRLWLPESYPEYEDARRLAGDVLSPVFVTGNVTKLRKTGDGFVYMLFSDGEYFADIELERGKDGVSIKRIEFRAAYFDGRNGLSFPERKITVPKGAVLTVNSVEYTGGAAEREADYPFFSPAEPDRTANCVEYTFRDIYFEPVLSATLNGVPLEAVGSEDGYEVCFKYPASLLKTVTLTVPAGADAFLGGVLLTEDWADKETIFGELGPLDDNGTGTLPQLSRWTVRGLFGNPDARASIGEDPVALLSSDGGNYVFEIPSSCRYTVSIAAPAGADVTVNGVALTAADVSGDGRPDPLGGTFIGKFGCGRIAAVSDGGTPLFAYYVREGYLAEPVVSASIGGTVLTPATLVSSGYDIRIEYDIPASSEQPDKSALDCASHFFTAYLKYVCDGGISDGRESSFDQNYDDLLSSMVEGTEGYTSIMESYRRVYRLPNHPGATISEPVCESVTAYNSGCVCLTLTSFVVADPAPEQENTEETTTAPGTEPVPAEMTVFLKKTDAGWRVYGFECEFEVADG